MFPSDISILIVDDAVTTRNLLVKFLGELGYSRIRHAAGGEQAWSIVTSASRPFDLIFCDWNMPQGSGLEFLKKIRSSDEAFNSVPFIMVTSERSAEKVREAVTAGVNNYMVKPFSLKVLTEKLQRTFEGLQKGEKTAA